MLGETQRSELATTGVVALPRVLSASEAGALEDRVWEHLVRRGIVRDDPSTWPAGFQSKLQGLRQSGVFNTFGTPAVSALLDEVLGAGAFTETEAWGPALVTFPTPAPWVLPHGGWHLDLPGAGNPAQPGALRLFGFVTDVAPGGGGTLVVEGSHHVVRRMLERRGPGAGPLKSGQISKRLKSEHEWFRDLHRPHDGRGADVLWDGIEIDGVTVRVRELTGTAGDIVAMLPWTMHAIAPNASDRPRLMVTHSVYRHDQPYFGAVPESPKRGPAPVNA